MTIHDEVVCPACGCFCDDLQVRVENHHITDIRRACPKGDDWIRMHSQFPDSVEAIIDGRQVSRPAGVQAVVELLLLSRFPLVCGLNQLDVEGQRAAVALADEVGAALDTGEDFAQAAIFFPTVGSMGCTWGEVIQRADVIVYWQCNSDDRQPRHRERILERIQDTRSVQVISDIPKEWDFATIWQLRALIQGRPTAVPPTGELTRWATTMRAAKYGVIIHDADHPDQVALQALASDINRHTRCRLVPLAGPSNGAGATEVMTWQTGFARGIGFHRGYPIATGNEFTAERLLRRGEVDLIVMMGESASGISEQIMEGLNGIPLVRVVLGCGEVKLGGLTPALHHVALFTSMPGIHTAGTVFRSDKVTLPLRSLVPTSLPSPALVLNEVLDAVRTARPRLN